jgi:V/A-type H+-transporting ATPase subunit I
MQRVALVGPTDALRDLLVRVADAGVVEIDLGDPAELAQGDAVRRQQHAGGRADPLLAPVAPDLDELERTGRLDLLSGEAVLEQVATSAVSTRAVSAVAGWSPAEALPQLATRLAEVGGAVVPLPRPRGSEPPTLLRQHGPGSSFRVIVQTYATVPYADLDPTPFAAAAYVVMFGMMFGDVGDGLLLVLAAVLARLGRPRLVARLRGVAPFLAAVGVAGVVFGAMYGEFFGPTGVIPVLWISPTAEPMTLLVVALGVGAVLLAGAYAIGTVNRVREGGWVYALYAPAGIAGSTVFLGVGLVVAGLATGTEWLTAVGSTVALVGLVLAFVGLRAAASGGWTGTVEAAIELFDLVIRLGANVVSFARLAAFGLTHAALSAVVWDATSALWRSSILGTGLGVVVFVVGNTAAFALEALVAGVQALRLEYYELFSRVFQGEGRPFRPWYVPTADLSAIGPPQEEQQ